jgi:hypothetical protein
VNQLPSAVQTLNPDSITLLSAHKSARSTFFFFLVKFMSQSTARLNARLFTRFLLVCWFVTQDSVLKLQMNNFFLVLIFYF